jgi:hypothetical protein
MQDLFYKLGRKLIHKYISYENKHIYGRDMKPELIVERLLIYLNMSHNFKICYQE